MHTRYEKESRVLKENRRRRRRSVSRSTLALSEAGLRESEESGSEEVKNVPMGDQVEEKVSGVSVRGPSPGGIPSLVPPDFGSQSE